MDSQVVALHNKKMLENSKKKLNESIVSLKRKLLSEKTQRYEKRAKKLEVDDLQVIETRLSRKKDESNQTLENGAVEIELSEIKQEIDVDDEPYASACNGTLHLEYDDIDVKSEVEEDTRKDEIPG